MGIGGGDGLSWGGNIRGMDGEYKLWWVGTFCSIDTRFANFTLLAVFLCFHNSCDSPAFVENILWSGMSSLLPFY